MGKSLTNISKANFAFSIGDPHIEPLPSTTKIISFFSLEKFKFKEGATN